MKHAGSSEDLKARATTSEMTPTKNLPVWSNPGPQSLLSKLIVFVACLFLVATIADAPVRALAQSLDPSVRGVLLVLTEAGNSAWPLGIGLMLLGLVGLLRRFDTLPPSKDIEAFRGMLILVISSVAVSGFLASLTKHVIGRIRPSTNSEAMVLEFSFMAFKAGWAAFPSGHATTATAAAVALALCFRRHAWAWLAVGMLTALSRALLGVHWLSDCLAGVALGAAVTVALHRTMIATGYHLDTAGEAFSSIASSTGTLVLRVSRKVAKSVATGIRGIRRSIGSFF